MIKTLKVFTLLTVLSSFNALAAPKLKLYHSPGSASSVIQIITNELDLKVDTEIVDLKTHKTEHGVDYYQINSKGTVPALMIDDKLLTESTAILQYLADLKPNKVLAKNGNIEKYRALEALGMLTEDLHKPVGLLFSGKVADEASRENLLKGIKNTLSIIDKTIANNEFIAGKSFSIADAYAFVALSWMKHFDIKLSDYKNIEKYYNNLQNRKSIKDLNLK